MAQLVVRNLEEGVKARLQRQASRHGHSMEEEVRDILRNAVRTEERAAAPLGSRIRTRFARIGLNEDLPELRGQKASPIVFGR
ncbi:MAG: toxin-antitoxin system [Candidatus Binatus sp.]|jgi:plasmid stability protein|uniref:FitA-like ribbon-helix-helix domain-containing protein n=1 Tax=Candidatus Binatus sp. TaxID=2811406 RepID=UPI003D121F77